MATSIIFPQHGGSELTLRALATFQEYHLSPVEIIVVDDGSTREHRQALQAAVPGITILPLARRQGVTAAWNAGAETASGETLVFLNNDTLTEGHWLTPLIAPLLCRSSQSSEEVSSNLIAKVGGRSWTEGMPRSSRSGVSLLTSLQSQPPHLKTSGMTLLTGLELRNEPYLPKTIGSVIESPEILSGWCLAIRRETFRELGGFDEQLRLYFSDTDLQCRLITAYGDGHLRPVAGLPLRHLGQRSTRQLADRSRTWREDRRRFLQKWNSG